GRCGADRRGPPGTRLLRATALADALADTASGGMLVPVPDIDAEPMPDYAAEVLDVVEAIPAGAVMTYGDVAEYVGRGGPRQVGQVMSRWGGAVPWWRGLKAAGSPPPRPEARAPPPYP